MAKIRDFVSGLICCIGASLSLFGLVILIIFASIKGDAFNIVSFTLYGLSLLLTYIFNTLYYWLNIKENKLNIFKKFTNIMSYVLIATSFTTICLGPLRGPWGWSIFGVIWGLSTIGIVFASIWIKIPKTVTIPLHILLGLLSVLTLIPLIYFYKQANLLYSLWWVLICSIFYFLSVLVRIFKWPKTKIKPFNHHEFFHILMFFGFLSQYWFILNYTLQF